MSSHAPALELIEQVEPTAHAAHRPRIRTVCKRVAATLLIACAVPATVFYVTLMVTDVWIAMVAALVWSYGAIAFRALTGRRTSGLLILTAAILTGRTVAAAVADSTFVYFLQPIISDGIVASAFMLSLASARPIVARLAGDFYPMDHELHMRPRIRRLFFQLTVMWAALCLGKATMNLWLLHSQSLETFVLVQGISAVSLNSLAAAATIAAAAVVGRKEGLLGPVAAVVAPAPVRH